MEDTFVLATLCYPQDRCPIVLTRKGKRKMTGFHLATDDLTPSGDCNGFPVYNIAILEENAVILAGRPVSIYRKADGWQYASCIPVQIGIARYCRNFAD